jgi:hypothetical protein
MISAGAGIAGKSAQLPGSPGHASTSSANISASVPARLSISQPGDRRGSCPAIHQQDPVPASAVVYPASSALRHHHGCKQAEGWWLQPEPGVLV